MDSDDKFFIAAGILMLAVIVFAGVMASREISKCTDNGGPWERVNCHPVEEWTCYSENYCSSETIRSVTGNALEQ